MCRRTSANSKICSHRRRRRRSSRRRPFPTNRCSWKPSITTSHRRKIQDSSKMRSRKALARLWPNATSCFKRALSNINLGMSRRCFSHRRRQSESDTVHLRIPRESLRRHPFWSSETGCTVFRAHLVNS